MAEITSILLKRKQAAIRLAISNHMLATLIRDGLIAETRIYGVSRIPVEEIERIAKNGTKRQSRPDQEADHEGGK